MSWRHPENCALEIVGSNLVGGQESEAHLEHEVGFLLQIEYLWFDILGQHVFSPW